VVLVLLEPTQESLQPCRSTTTISRISVGIWAQYPPLAPQLMHAAQQHRLGSKRAVLFRPIRGTKQDGFSIGFRPNMELCWVGSVRLAELHWQRRQVYRLRGFNWIRSSGSGGSSGPEKTSEPGFWCGSRRRIEASCPGLVGTHPSPISREPSFHRPSLRAAVWPGSTRTPSRLSLAWLGFSGRLCKAMGTRRKFDRSGSGGVFRVAPGDGDGYCFG